MTIIEAIETLEQFGKQLICKDDRRGYLVSHNENRPATWLSAEQVIQDAVILTTF
jgi:hypothetical protein